MGVETETKAEKESGLGAGRGKQYLQEGIAGSAAKKVVEVRLEIRKSLVGAERRRQVREDCRGLAHVGQTVHLHGRRAGCVHEGDSHRHDRGRLREGARGKTGAVGRVICAQGERLSGVCRYLELRHERVGEGHVAREGREDEVAQLNAGGRDAVAEARVVFAEELWKVVQEHEQHPQRALVQHLDRLQHTSHVGRHTSRITHSMRHTACRAQHPRRDGNIHTNKTVDRVGFLPGQGRTNTKQCPTPNSAGPR